MSKYAVATGNGYSGSRDITPMTADKARQWLEETGNFEGLEAYFPDMMEDA